MQASIVPRDSEASLRQCVLKRCEEGITHIAGMGTQTIHMPLKFAAPHKAGESKLINRRNCA